MSTATDQSPVRARYLRSARETGFLLAQLPLGITAFVVALVALAAGVPLLVTVVGFVVVALLLAGVNVLGEVTRGWLRRLGYALEQTSRPLPGGESWYRRRVRRLAHGQSWMDLLRGILTFPLSVATFIAVVVWWVVGAASVVYWLWSRFLPDDDAGGLAWLLGLDPRVEWVLYLVVGLAMLLLAPWVVRGLVYAHVGLERFALLPSRHARLSSRVADLTASRAALVDGEAQVLRRLERDLHDGPQQRLVRTTMDVETALRRIDDGDAEAARVHLSSALTQVEAGLAELRSLSRGLAPPVLADRGLEAAVASLAGQSGLPVRLDIDLEPEQRYDLGRETVAYFVVSEALANANKHSGATAIHVRIDETGADALRVQVSDDGKGGAHVGKGHGLAGLVDRLRGVDGTLEVDSPDDGGTTVRAMIPL